MSWFLIDASGFRYPIGEGGLRIGRATDNDVVLNDEEVSRHHALVHRRGDGLWLQDLDSANGVFVNGARMTGAGNLRAGDEIRLGHTRLGVYRELAAPPQTSAAVVGFPWRAVLIGAALGLILLGVTLLIILWPTFTPANSTNPTDSAYRDAIRATAYILAPLEDGPSSVPATGAVLSADGRLLTAYSAVYDPATGRPYNRKSQALVGLRSDGNTSSPDQWYLARVVRADRQRDLAVLQIFAQVDGSPLPNSFALDPVAMGDSTQVQPNDPLAVISFAGSGAAADAAGRDLLFGEGRLVGFQPDASGLSDDGRGWIETDIGLNPTHLGGLALNQRGQLVGIYTGANTDTRSLIRPIEIARLLLAGR